MDRKNKVMLIAAIGAVVVLIASSAVRCAVSRAADAPGSNSQSAQAESSQAETAASAETASRGAKEGPESGAPSEGAGDSPEGEILKQLRSHAWQAEGDSGTTIAFREGSFVESNADGVKVTAVEVKDATVSDGHASLDVELVRDGEEPFSSLIAIDKGADGLAVSCDGFSNCPKYVEGGATEKPVSVEGLADSYANLVEGKTDELAASIDAYCKDHVPTATKAAFDGEVFLDIPGGRVTATFHCDDKASTILSVTYADGAFSVAG